ncbi:MAG: hypothetical protein K2Y05_12160, partial [Hyphomicrobiaceae bacterium]|nr:hypothetical protein [Hyphomicrobiaceae bacterium]
TFDESLGDRVRVSIVASGMLRQVGATPAPPYATPPIFQTPPAAPPSPAPAVSPQGAARGNGSTAPSAAQSNGQAPAPPVHAPQGRSNGPAPAHTAQDSYPPPHLNMPTGGHSPSYDASGLEQHAYDITADARADGDMQRRLSAALTLTVAEDFVPGDRRDASAQSREAWRGGGVTIEETSPLGSADELPSRVPTSARPVRPEEPPFRPELTADVRRQPRRVPEIDEFPALAQREFQGRKEPPRKPGLFERLAGMGRRGDDSNHSEATNNGFGANPRNEPQHNARQTGSGSPPRSPQGAPQSGGQASDMPALLRKDRR